MKRHPSLYPLSRDHHHALVQARKLSLAGAANKSSDLTLKVSEFAEFWEKNLKAHFLLEEQYLLPLLAKTTTPQHELIRETLDQHVDITRLVDVLRDKLSSLTLTDIPLLEELGEALRRHIRFEENQLFPLVEASATDDELLLLNEQFEQDHASDRNNGCSLSTK